jgi:ABC-2 type transport system permease protein
MNALVQSELLKFWTTRARWAYLGVLLLVSGISVAGEIGTNDESRLSDPGFQTGLVEVTGVASLLAIILAITVVTSEYRHGTITPTLLAAPVRDRVVLAKALAASVVAAGFTLVALVAVVVVAGFWLTIEGVTLHLLEADVFERAVQSGFSAVLWALLGIGIGAVVASQVGALLGTLIWIFVVENLIWGLLGLLDLDGAVRYLPFRALDAADGVGGGDLLDYWPGVVVSLCWIAAIGAAGVVATRRRDIT